MKFPVAVIDLDHYFEKIVEVIDSPDCKIFIDTNILAKYYVFHSQARKELNEFLQQYVVLKRIMNY